MTAVTVRRDRWQPSSPLIVLAQPWIWWCSCGAGGRTAFQPEASAIAHEHARTCPTARRTK